MAIIRAKHQNRYTVITDSIMKDPRLSLREIGLLAVMLRLPDDWTFSIAGLASICKDGRSAVRSAVQTLEACGYVVRTEVKDPVTNLRRVAYTVHEEPVSRAAAPRLSENRTPENRTAENRTLPNTERHSTERPNTDRQNTEEPKSVPSDVVPGANAMSQEQGAKGTNAKKTDPKRVLSAKKTGESAQKGVGVSGKPYTAAKPYPSGAAAGAAPAKPYTPSPRKRNAFSRAEELQWRAQLKGYAPPDDFWDTPDTG